MKAGNSYAIADTEHKWKLELLPGEHELSDNAIAQAVAAVSKFQGPHTVYVVKVLAVVRRSAAVEQ
jgi:hypothetical protein